MAVPRAVRGWGCRGRTEKMDCIAQGCGRERHTLVWDTQLGGSGGGGGQGLCGRVGLMNGAGKNERKPARRARGGRAMKRCVFGRVTWRRMRLLYR